MITITKHLQLIKAECERLLAIAEKRTPGEWTYKPHTIIEADDGFHLAWSNEYASSFGDNKHKSNAQFIAACAGRAEAGRRATIAAIDKLTFDQSGNAATIEIILDAWPLELLNNKPQ
jgi:hypothetical protein